MLRILLFFTIMGLSGVSVLQAQKLYISPSDYAVPQVEPVLKLYPTIANVTLGNPAFRPRAVSSELLKLDYRAVRAESPPVSTAFMPGHERENPYGYSYLCRMELKAEESLPIGVWLKLGEQNGVKGIPGSPANVQMKLFRF